MNQVPIVLAVAAGALLTAAVALGIWGRIRKCRDTAAATSDPCRAAFEQSPNGILIVDAGTLRILDANSALQRTLGFRLEELTELDLTQVFSAPGESSETLLRKLRDPNPRVPFQIRQCCKDGSLDRKSTRLNSSH